MEPILLCLLDTQMVVRTIQHWISFSVRGKKIRETAPHGFAKPLPSIPLSFGSVLPHDRVEDQLADIVS